jgi:hypothetical protein
MTHKRNAVLFLFTTLMLMALAIYQYDALRRVRREMRDTVVVLEAADIALKGCLAHYEGHK